MNKAYISLGSNEGQKLENLQQAVLKVQKEIGILTELSSLYQTPAWGFEGPDFLNACIGIKTRHAPNKVLEKLLGIEREMGRFRHSQSGYSSRNIDLDLLFYSDEVIENEALTLPHPRLELRNFILHPMSEIARDFIHPRLGMNMVELSTQCLDTSQPIQLPLAQWSPDLFTEHELLVFEGNIGVGKTVLTQKIGQHYHVPQLLENFNQNPYLEKFYQQPERYALALESYFLEDRFRQFGEFYSVKGPTKKAVTDHSLYRSLIFAKINLSSGDFKNFKEKFKQLSSAFYFQQKVILLNRSLEVLMEQIQNRGRVYEQKISLNYLKRIEDRYVTFIQEETSVPFHKIDLKGLDFVNDESAYQIVLQRIKAF